MFNFFKGFFGSSDLNDGAPKNFNNREDFLKKDDDVFPRSFSNSHDEHMGFNVFSNPLEMHRYFESQLNSMLKSFGMTGDGPFFGFNESRPDLFSNFLEAPEEPQAPSNGDLRDQFLKPGYQQPHSRIEDRSDSDVDGKINLTELDSIFSGKTQLRQPHQERPKMHSFGRQVVTKSFTNHNGLIQSQQTVKDDAGNEETIVTYKRGDQEYTKIIKVDKNGQQEIKENFVNISEGDLGKFFGSQNMIRDSPNIPDRKHPNWFPFNKYFK